MSLLSVSLLASILMPALPPGQQIPGTVPGSGPDANRYPQYGVSGSAPDFTIITARNNAEKLQDISNGASVWFTTRSGAQNFINSQKGLLSGNVPGLSGLAAIGDFFARLTEANTWIRVGEFLAGALILYIGLKAVVAPEGKKVATRTAKQTARSIVEHTTPAGRTERAIRTHRP